MLTSLFTRSKNRARAHRTLLPRLRFQPRLETLENRDVPSTITVTNLDPTGDGSLLWAVTKANGDKKPDLIQFKKGLTGTITLTGEISIINDLTIDGPGAGAITVSGNNLYRVFHITGAKTAVTIDNLTIANGLANDVTFNEDYGPVTLGGGILEDGGKLTVSDVTFTGNQAIGPLDPFGNGDNSDGGGGAIASVHGANLTVTHCAFKDNTASGLDYSGGGAIVSDGGRFTGTTATIDHSSFTHNLATQAVFGASGGGALWDGTATAMTVSYCTFDNNQALGGSDEADGLAGHGLAGAIFAEPFGFFNDPPAGSVSSLRVNQCKFNANLAIAGNGGYAQGDGGGIYLDSGSVATVAGSSFTENRSRASDVGSGATFAGDAFGAAISNASSTLTVTNTTFERNVTQGGSGGPGVAGGQALGGAVASTFSNGTPDLFPLTTIDNCKFDGNRAIGGTGYVDLTNPDLIGFFAQSARGGAIDNIVGTLYLSNSQFTNNVAQGGSSISGNGGNARGGALANEFGAAAYLSNVSIVDNHAIGGAGGMGDDGGSAFGGGIFNGMVHNGQAATMTIASSTIDSNQALGGTGGLGGNGGNAQGGGIYNGNAFGLATPLPQVTLTNTAVTENSADGGTAGGGGSPGQGLGGGIYNLGVLTVDKLGLVHDNEASTNYDNIFSV